MFQRTVHRRRAAGDRRRPPWTLLVESGEAGVDISDFGAFRDAGFDVSVCSGPTAEPGECPVVRGEPCALLVDADVVLFDLGDAPPLRSEVLAAMRSARPELPVVVRSAGPPGDAAQGCPAIRTTTSVNGQVSALHKAVLEYTTPRA